MIVGCKCGKSHVVSKEPDLVYGQYYCVVLCEECGYYWEGYMGHCFAYEDIFGHEKEEEVSK